MDDSVAHAVVRAAVAQELEEVLASYKQSQSDFQRLWLGEDRDNPQFRAMIGWYDRTILPIQQKLTELKKSSN
jgi:hypothetical protein